MIHTGGKYSQNNEDALIERYFGLTRKGTLLSLGENDGKTLSNTLAAIERGWTGVLVEPSETAFKKLEQLHNGRPEVYCLQVAVGDMPGIQDFYESGEHLGTGDTSLISTLKQEETVRWKGSKFDNFTPTKVEVMTWPDLYSLFPIKEFNLVSIDCEGMEKYLFQVMDFTLLKTEMVIVEWNMKDKEFYTSIASSHGMRLYGENMENLIFVK